MASKQVKVLVSIEIRNDGKVHVTFGRYDEETGKRTYRFYDSRLNAPSAARVQQAIAGAHGSDVNVHLSTAYMWHGVTAHFVKEMDRAAMLHPFNRNDLW